MRHGMASSKGLDEQHPGKDGCAAFFLPKKYGLGVQAKVVNHEGYSFYIKCKVHPYLLGLAMSEGVQ